MLISKKVALGVILAASSALVLAACGSSGSGGGGGSNPGSSTNGSAAKFIYNKGPSGGSSGGTLKVLAQDEPSNFDSPSVYDTASNTLARLFARDLYSYKASNDINARLPVQPDLADGMPQISDDKITYMIKIKQGADWDINGTGRQVTAQDAIRGLKLTCNPQLPFGAPYFTNSIAGMQAFCDGFAKVDGNNAAAVKKYEESTPVSGMTATDATTMTVKLTKPFPDFIHFVALPSAAPVNVEQLNYVLDSPQYRAHTYSDGPYRITAYTASKNITLARNPVWKASTDDLRKAYADAIDITIGGDETTNLQQIQAGTADSTFSNDPLPTTAIPGLLSSNNPGIHVNPIGGTNPYVVFNLAGGNGALKNKLVRQAIGYGVDKRAISTVLGGSRINPVINQIFSQSVVGAGWQQQNLYPTPNNAGDATKAKKLLSQAGYPNGLTLKMSYRTKGNGPVVADSLKTSLAKAGINLQLKGVVNSNYYGNYLQKTSIAKSGDWDLAEPGWSADWEGSAERSYFTPLFDGRLYTDGTTNFGDYNDPTVNSVADAALAESDPAKAATDWNNIDKMIMQDLPLVPLIENNQANFVSSRVKNFQFYAVGEGPDLANLAVQ